MEIFPQEIPHTYYKPYCNGKLSTGKLYDAYNNYRTELSAAGIIKRKVWKTQSEVIARNDKLILTKNFAPNFFKFPS